MRFGPFGIHLQKSIRHIISKETENDPDNSIAVRSQELVIMARNLTQTGSYQIRPPLSLCCFEEVSVR